MNITRGEVYKARFDHASGGRGKKRPVVIVQADVYNNRLRHAVVAQVTGNLSDKGDPACYFLDASSPEGKAAGIKLDSLVSCYLLNLINEDRLTEKIGQLPAETMDKISDCLKSALGIP